MDSSAPASDLPWKKIVKTAVHEIRTPLSSLRTSVEILRMDRLDNEETQKLITMMTRQIETISEQLGTLSNRPEVFLDSTSVPHE